MVRTRRSCAMTRLRCTMPMGLSGPNCMRSVCGLKPQLGQTSSTSASAATRRDAMPSRLLQSAQKLRAVQRAAARVRLPGSVRRSLGALPMWGAAVVVCPATPLSTCSAG
eukprot:scaffold3504_cov240-Pinguiococcus_pyrenoidosus.AAC.40